MYNNKLIEEAREIYSDLFKNSDNPKTHRLWEIINQMHSYASAAPALPPSREVKELKDYADKLSGEPTIYYSEQVINKLLTMIYKLPPQFPSFTDQDFTIEEAKKDGKLTLDYLDKLIEHLQFEHKRMKDKIAILETSLKQR